MLDLKYESVYSVIDDEIKITLILIKTIWPSPEVYLNTLNIDLVVVRTIIQ